MVDQIETGPVVARGQVRLGDRLADGVGQALSERARAHLDPWRNAVLGMTGRDAAPLPELLDLLQGQIVARQVQQAIQQHRTMPGREHEPIAIEPLRMGRVVTQMPGPEHVGHGAAPIGKPGVAAVGLFDRVD